MAKRNPLRGQPRKKRRKARRRKVAAAPQLPDVPPLGTGLAGLTIGETIDAIGVRFGDDRDAIRAIIASLRAYRHIPRDEV
jgi:hypothetical protein